MIDNIDPNDSFKIGNDSYSESVKPNIALKIIKGKNIYLFDTPGFFDTNGAINKT